MKNIPEFTEDELVSIDFKGNPHSSIVDSGCHTRGWERTVQKVLVQWYDNEWGYLGAAART